MALPPPSQLFCFTPAQDGPDEGDNGFNTYGHQEICIRPGLWMNLINFASDRPITLAYEKQYPVIDFGFVISGDIQRKTGRTGPEAPGPKTGISGARLENRQTGSFAIPANQKQQLLHLHMTLPLFRDLVKEQCEMLPPKMQAVARGASKVEFTRIRPMTPDIQSVVYQIINTSSNALPWSLYLEGKSLELISLHLAALGIEHQQSKTRLLNRSEKRKISEARTLLVKDLQNPPGLDALASATGLSAAKLQTGFRQAFGCSVFDYFREFRMQEALRLLHRTETNVSETAWQVGYTNVSHFTAAFKKRFGILPKHYLKNRLTELENAPPRHQALISHHNTGI